MQTFAARCALPFALLLSAAALADASPKATVPITTSSAEARALFVQGRDLVDRLRGTDARALYEKAVAKDPQFATAWLGLANTAQTNRGFFEALGKAVELADKTSEGERLAILAAQAGATSDPAGAQQRLERVVELFPNDERAVTALGNFYFGRQEWSKAVKLLQRATELAPAWSPPYNQLGYSYRFQDDYPAAEKAFRRYTEVLPQDPNPYDSYAELLMKLGRFEESITNYQKALANDPNFVSAYIGIAFDQMMLGRGDAARGTLHKLRDAVARTDGERRQACFWIAESFVHEGRFPEALAAVAEEEAIAKKADDQGSRAQDQNFMGNLLLQAGKTAEAAKKFAQSVATLAKAKVPPAVKEAARRNHRFDAARVALAKGDLKTAEAQAAAYRSEVEAKQVLFEVWRADELAGMIALAKKDWDGALTALARANPRDPRVVYLSAVALAGKGDQAGAQAAARRAADYNEITNANYAYVRADARKMLQRSDKG